MFWEKHKIVSRQICCFSPFLFDNFGEEGLILPYEDPFESRHTWLGQHRRQARHWSLVDSRSRHSGWHSSPRKYKMH